MDYTTNIIRHEVRKAKLRYFLTKWLPARLAKKLCPSHVMSSAELKLVKIADREVYKKVSSCYFCNFTVYSDLVYYQPLIKKRLNEAVG